MNSCIHAVVAIRDEIQDHLIQLRCEMIHPVANDPLPDELTVALPFAKVKN